MALITEEDVEHAALGWFRALGYQTVFGPDLAPDGRAAERRDYRHVVLTGRLLAALQRLNPKVPPQTLDAVALQLANPNVPGLLAANRHCHLWLTQGVPVTYLQDGQQVGTRVRVLDYDTPTENDWLVANQFSVRGSKKVRRPDLVVFVNGLPLAVLELKNPADENADIWKAFEQLQTYKEEIPDLFLTNVALVISDGTHARIGSLSANEERFPRWRTIDAEPLDPLGHSRDLETLVRGVFDHRRVLDLTRHYCLFEDTKGGILKLLAAYHQFHAVQVATERVVAASRQGGDRRGGVVWHTQGAGKSLEMTCLAGKLLTDPRLENPTLVVVTDRTNLDGQLYGVFASAGALLAESPQQATSRSDLRDKLGNRPSGGIIFTTIQKFAPDGDESRLPPLSTRRNIIVLCDEAHRTQYGFKAWLDAKTGTVKYGLARALRDALPDATFLAFTGTPIAHDDRDTQAVFGSYISIYDIQQAVEDGATVPIYYESRLAKLDLKPEMLSALDARADDIFAEEDDIPAQERAKTRWAALEALVGAQPRIDQIAADLVQHFEQRQRAITSKAMVVCMSRDICARLYAALIARRPDWHDDDLHRGVVKVVMTSSASDPALLRKHSTNKDDRKTLETRFKDPADPLQIVLVRDMWLTGFDAPCLATMYVDKPMQGAQLAQAIARVNRVFRDKPGGLVVDYIGIAPQLKEALATYSASHGRGTPAIDTADAFRILEEKLSVARDLLHPIDWSGFRTNALQLLPLCLDHVLAQPEGRQRFCDTVLSITKAFALCGTTDRALVYAEDIAFLQAVRASLVKGSDIGTDGTPPRQVDAALRQLLSEALVAQGVTDVFAIAGLTTPDLSILSDEFLAEVAKLPQKHLAVELLQRLLRDEVATRFRTNVVKQRRFSEMLQASLGKYANRSIEAAQVIVELIELAKHYREDANQAARDGLSVAERAFYDALADNPSAREQMQHETLRAMARELAQKLREHASVDWEVRDSVRATLRLMVKTLLKRYKYPPDHEVAAIELVLQQAEGLANDLHTHAG